LDCRGCGRSPLGIMRIARRRMVTRPHERPRWQRLLRVGGGSETEAPGSALPRGD
jgi:hypothetical protein